MRRAALAAALLLALVVGGCLGPSGPPEERARRALDALVAELSGGSGTLSKLAGTMSASGYSVGYTLDIARDGTRHFNMSVSGFALDFYCGDGRVVRIEGGKALEQRGDACPLESSRYGSMAQFASMVNVSDTHVDGRTMTATFTGARMDDEQVGALNATIDRSDRITRFTMTSPGGTMTGEATYGGRHIFKIPATQGRVPAGLDGDEDVDDGQYEWEADNVADNVTLDELEVRVQDPTTKARLATFRMDAPGEQNVSGFVFYFEDRDGDGRISERDRFTINHTGWERRGQYEVVVWDTWADAPVARRLLPGPGLLVIGAAVALAVAAATSARRRA